MKFRITIGKFPCRIGWLTKWSDLDVSAALCEASRTIKKWGYSCQLIGSMKTCASQSTHR